MRRVRRWMTPRQRWLVFVVALALLFVAFEMGIRLITPDAVESTITFVPCKVQSLCTTTMPLSRSGRTTDPRTIAMYQALLAPPNESKSLVASYLATWGGATCAPLTTYTVTLRFTWHGIPVEAASPGPGCDNGWSQVSSGGLPDLNMYTLDFFGR